MMVNSVVERLVLAHKLLVTASGMGLFHLRIVFGRLCRRPPAVRWIIIGLLASGSLHSTFAAQPVLSVPVWGGDRLHAHINLANCSDTNVQYVIQMSTNLTHWIPVSTNAAAPTNFSVIVPTGNQACFYRAMTIPARIPLFQNAIVTRSNFAARASGITVDSFDSSNTNYSTGGQWDFNKRKANGSVATPLSVIGAISLDNNVIYGRVYTGPGTSQSAVQFGPHSAVGDVEWNTSYSGIEPGYWAGDYNVKFADVATPMFTGVTLPAVANGKITLNGGNYIAFFGPTSPLIITAPTTLWVQGSFSLAGITITNTGSLVLYVGTANGVGDSLNLSGSGMINTPGYAANLLILGLPSLTSISDINGAGFIGSIYAPEADFSGGGVGNNSQDSSGALVVKTVILNGHWNFHFDESLLVKGPFH